MPPRMLPPHRLALTALAALWALDTTSMAAEPASEMPTWYRKRQEEVRKKAREEAVRRAERDPDINGPVTESTTSHPTGRRGKGTESPDSGNPNPGVVVELSTPKNTVPEYNQLFKRPGFTAIADLSLGVLSQTDMGGYPISGGYALGWWWSPNLVLTLQSHGSALFSQTYTFMLLRVGPSLRYFLGRNLAFSGGVSYGLSMGLSRVPASHIPSPPSDTALQTRRGVLATGQAAYLFWKRRDFGIGPAITATYGSQSERSVFEFTVGITYQDGKPNYTGDVTQF